MAKNIPLISIFSFSCTEKDKSVSSNDIFGCSDPISTIIIQVQLLMMVAVCTLAVQK